MEALILHLRKLIKINSRILNELAKDEPETTSISDAFEEREVHTKKLSKLVPTIDKEKISEKNSDMIKGLFEQFNRQAKNIQNTLNDIVDDSRDKLNDAVKRRKAEEGYRALKS